MRWRVATRGIDGCRFSSPSGVEVGSFSYTLAFSRLTSVLSRCRILAWLVFLGEVARPGLVSMPGLDTVILVLPFPSWAISPFRRWCRSSLLAMLGTDLVLFLALRPRLASLSVAVLTCLPFFPCLFLWSRRSMVLGRGSAEVLPSGWFPLAVFLRVLPPLWRWRVWMVESCRPIRSSGRLPGACLLLSSSPLALHGVVSTSPVCLSRAPAFRQVRVAMLAEGSVASPSVLVLAFHSSLFLVEGSSDGSAPGDRFLSPGRLCFFTPSFC